MPTGQIIYFTVTAKNNGGGSRDTTCQLSTYDQTLPTGRVRPQFETTSNPTVLKVSIMVTDDTEIVTKKVSEQNIY